MSELATLQKWLTSIIVRPGMLGGKIKLADEHYQLKNDKVIRPSLKLSATQKIEIYSKGYILRLLECMEAEYPALNKLLGKNLFHTFVKAYLVQLPPNSPDLYNLGEAFPAFLKASQPQTNTSDDDVMMYNLPVDLAIFERCIAEISRMEGLENRVEENTGNQMPYLFNTTAVCTSPCLKLLNLQFPLADFVQNVYNDLEPEMPVKQDSLVCICRKNYRINFHELETWQWHFLNRLQNKSNYMAAVMDVANICNIPTDTIMADLILWIPVAISFGYVYLK
ncbi:HvfC/BufC family peptide modification chaperone [Mucilaginibacter sp.]